MANPLNVERPSFLAEEDIVIFEDAIGKFFDDHAPESRTAKWREDGMVERVFWNEAAEAGLPVQRHIQSPPPVTRQGDLQTECLPTTSS